MKKAVSLQIILYGIVYLVLMLGCNSSSQDARAVTGTELADTLKDDAGFTGIYKSYHPDGYLYSEVSYKDGKKDGISRRFYSDGKVHSIIEYREGKKVGTSKWLYTSGEVYRETPYADGKVDGIQKKLYRDGTVQAEIPYSQGNRKVGLREYNERGTLFTSYPEIRITPIDRIETHGRYTLELRLSNNSKNVKFYYDAVKDSLFIPEGKQYILTDEGVGMVEFVYRETGGYPQHVNLVAVYRTRYGNSKILQKSFRLPNDHLVY
jgi:antitoxin component YwqK of YwqJK toxin-antitoxin module